MTQNARILELLADGEPHSFHEILRHVPCVVHSRVSELRSRGYAITCERVADDYLYTLHASPLDDPLCQQPAVAAAALGAGNGSSSGARPTSDLTPAGSGEASDEGNESAVGAAQLGLFPAAARRERFS